MPYFPQIFNVISGNFRPAQREVAALSDDQVSDDLRQLLLFKSKRHTGDSLAAWAFRG